MAFFKNQTRDVDERESHIDVLKLILFLRILDLA